MQVLKGLKDLVFPRGCTVCGHEPQAHQFLCWECRNSFVYSGPGICSVCGNPVSGQVEAGYTCMGCMKDPPAFEKARCALKYEAAAAAMLQSLKYQGATWLAGDLGQILGSAVKVHYPEVSFHCVTWVPSTPLRRRSRGFNQAELLARALAPDLGLHAENLLRCRRHLPSQTHLTANQRKSNVGGAYRAGSSARGRDILLVDDVMTTGATLNACAHALKQAGAGTVYAVAVARR